MATNFEDMEQNATQTIEVNTENNTPENFEKNATSNGIVISRNEDGEITGYSFNNSVVSQDDNGYIQKTTPSDIIVEKDSSSTTENIILNFITPPEATTEGGSTIRPGSSLMYSDRDEFIKQILNNTGLDVDMNEITAEDKNYLYDVLHPFSETALGDTRTDMIKTQLRLHYNPNTQSQRTMSFGGADAMYAIIHAAAQLGYYSTDDIFIDDPIFQATMREASAGDFIRLSPIQNEYEYDDPRLSSAQFLRPMLFEKGYYEFVVGSTIDFPQSFEEYTLYMSDKLITERVAENMLAQYGVEPNAWLAWCWTQNKNNIYFALYGIHLANDNQFQIQENYPELGYAVLDLNHAIGFTGCGEIYVGDYNNYFSRNWESGRSWSNTHVDRMGHELIIVYDADRFYEYCSDDSVIYSDIAKPIMISNGRVQQAEKPGVHKRDDALQVTPSTTVNDIEAQIELQYPEYYNNSYTQVEYNPVTNEYVTKRYYTFGGGNNIPRDPTPNPSNVTYLQQYTPLPNTSEVPEASVDLGTGSNKLYTIYKLTDTEVDTLGSILWDPSILQTIKNIFQSPTDGIISFHKLFLTPKTDATSHTIKMGSISMDGATGKWVTEQVIDIDAGYVNIPRFYNDARDYDETSVQLYIPFSGYHDLSPRDVIGNQLRLQITCDVITGTFVATVYVKKVGISGNGEEHPLYMFDGNCSLQIPMTAADKSRLWTGLASAFGGAVSGVAHGAMSGPAGMIAGGIGGALGSLGGLSKSIEINRGNGFSSQAGALTRYKTPFIVINRMKPADAVNYNELYGYPAQAKVKLSECSGFVKCKEVHVEDINHATDREKQMIESLLKQGIFI